MNNGDGKMFVQIKWLYLKLNSSNLCLFVYKDLLLLDILLSLVGLLCVWLAVCFGSAFSGFDITESTNCRVSICSRASRSCSN